MFIPNTSSRVTLSPGIVAGSTSTTPFTVEGWFYSTVTPGTNAGPVLLSTDTASANPTYAKALTVNLSSTTTIVVDSNGAAAQTFTFAETMLINTWYYVAVTRDSSGYIRAWLGKKGDTNATASITNRVNVSGNAAWNLTGLSNTIGAFVPAGRYTTGYISNLRVDSTSLYATTAATIPVPTAPFEELAGAELTIPTNDAGGLGGWSSTALAVTYNPEIISTFSAGSTITFQDNTTATITQIDPYSPTYIDIYWDIPKTGTLFPITLNNRGTVFLQNDATLTDQTGNQTVCTFLWVGHSIITFINPIAKGFKA
jgi:hypothetical protein